VHPYFVLSESCRRIGLHRLPRLAAIALLGLLGFACGTLPASHENAAVPTETAIQLKASDQLSRLPAAGTAPVAAPAPTHCATPDESRSIHFAADSSQLTAADHAVLRRIATQYKENPQAHISLVGHANEKGSAEMVIALANRRVEAVADFLESLGVPSRRIRRNAQPGDLSAAASACAQVNRRVDLRLID
jgi:outer membrane protein OmpA-like peptidoglycan-associated protein